MNKFLIIGSNSFSGSHCVNQLLEQGFEVIGISRSNQPNEVFLPYKWKNKNDNNLNFIFHKIDINYQLKELIDLIDAYKPSHIINFASQGMVAESWLNPTQWYTTNVTSQVALHDELRKRNFIKKFVHITTPEVYGSTDQGWIKENFNFTPSTPYAVSRASCDLHLKSFFKAYSFPVVFTRAANVYGPGQQLYRIIPRTILSILTGKKLNLHGGGLSKRSFIHIQDVIDATIKIALGAEPGTSWHISTNEVISIKQLVEKICTYGTFDFKEIVNIENERLGKDQNYFLDSSKLRKNFNWQDKIKIDDGLKGTISWAERNISLLEKLPWEYIHQK